MKILVCIMLLCLSFFTGHAQNIVQNGSFEQLTQCPTSPGEVYYATPWYPGGSDSSDLLNTCGTGEFSTVPVNVSGFQIPRTGNGYVRVATYVQLFGDARELIMQPINYCLVANSQYYFEMYVSLADSFKYATHNIGIVFTDTVNDWMTLDCLFMCLPVVENNSANPLKNKADWTKVSGTFTAQGWEKYIFIGNMRPDSLTEIEFVGGSVGNGQYTWEESGYYVDDVWLSHIDSMHYAGVAESVMFPINVWPNPTQDELSVDLDILGNKTCQLKVFDLFGRTVIDLNTKTSVIQLDLTPFASGPYMMVIRDSEGRMAVQRIMKE